ncbi:WYL domain-containing protein [Proteiniborus sp. MB09-C3]|uniref:helix-turn-helix transcriptional regulator n=1 Tax=Proteiniborus sp. MB09-C3 TaxID=3050072 RepID=UPI0025557154|nr:WYL domain-containing protein [Proteiniborus sp. MB09-C3]WIV12459.1 WYL domain-containing protein [Proteiniborus sp. MB09-C3]
MLGYCRDKKDYRLFKVVRMRNLKKLEKPFSIKHEGIDNLLIQHEKQDNQKYIHVKMLCKKEVHASIEEYFPNAKIIAYEDGDFILQFHALMNEIVWKGLLFTYGNKIRIIEPEELKTEFMLKAKEIVDIYD